MTNERPTWCHLLFYFTYYALNMFRTLIYPSSGACDCVDELPHRSSCSQFVVCWSFCCGWYLVVFVLQASACKTNTTKIASDIKLVFHSSNIAKMHGPINIRTDLIFSPCYLFEYIIYLRSQLPRISLCLAVNIKISDE